MKGFVTGRQREPQLSADEDAEQLRGEEKEEDSQLPAGEVNEGFVDHIRQIEVPEPHSDAGDVGPNKSLHQGTEYVGSTRDNEEVDLEQIVEDLRAAQSATDRAAAVRALGKAGSQRATPHLVAAMFDDDPAVRQAAEEAMGELDGLTSTELKEPPAPQPDAAEKDAVSELSANSPESAKNDMEEQATVEASHDSSHGRAQLHLEAAGTSTGQPPVSQIIADAEPTDEEELLIQEHQTAHMKVKELQAEIFKRNAARTGHEKQTLWRIKREARLRAEAAERIHEEEQVRKRVEEEAQLRRVQELELIKAEQEARTQAETEAQRLAEEERSLRLEVSSQTRLAEETFHRHDAMVAARKEAARAAQYAEVARARAEAEQSHQTEIERLRLEQANLEALTTETVSRRAQVEEAKRHQQSEIERLIQEEESLEAATEEAARRRAEVEAARQRAQQDAESLAAAHGRMRVAEEARATAEAARVQAEAELLERVETEQRLLTEARQHAHQEQQRLAQESSEQLASLESQFAALKSEAETARAAAEQRSQAEIERLQSEEERLHTLSAEAAQRRAEVEAARERADREAKKLAEAQARMRTAEEVRAKAEATRVKLEAELLERVEKEERLLEAARKRVVEEETRFEQEAKRQQQVAEQRLTEVERAREASQLHHRQLAEREQQITTELDSLRITDTESRKRITEAEVRKNSAEENCKRLALQIQRIEAEAHASTVEEQNMLARLETESRLAATQSEARAEQEKRIREQIESFHRLEKEEGLRLKALTVQRASVEARLQETRERIESEEAAKLRAEREIEIAVQSQADSGRRAEVAKLSKLAKQAPSSLPVDEVEPVSAEARENADEIPSAAEPREIPAAISSYLHSSDPYKRAASLMELARSDAKDAFDLIVKSFDDPSVQVRNAAARALCKLEPTRTVDLFNRALEEATPARRTNIGAAIAGSGLASEAVDNLVSDRREETYNALSILFVMAKAGEVQPLVTAVEEHANEEVCRAAIKLLTLSSNSDVADAALQRRVLGVAASRQKTADKKEESGADFRQRLANAEVKRATNGRQTEQVDSE